MSLSSIHERTWKAAMSLATSASSIQERIGNAYLDILPLKPEEFPEDLRGKFEEIVGIMSTGSTYEVTAAAMNSEKAEEVATLVFDLHSGVYFQFLAAYDTGEPEPD